MKKDKQFIKSTIKALSKFKKREAEKEKKQYENRNDVYVKDEPSSSFNDYMFSDPSEEIKSKSRNLIYRLLELRDSLNISINNHSVQITMDDVKKINKAIPYPGKSNSGKLSSLSNDWFSLEIINKSGLIISFRDKRLAYKDIDLYTETIENIKNVFTTINNNNFDNLYNVIMVESGLARNSNLDDLLNS